MDQAQLSLRPKSSLLQTIQDIKALKPDLKLCVMSNISRVRHFQFQRKRTNLSAGAFQDGSESRPPLVDVRQNLRIRA